MITKSVNNFIKHHDSYNIANLRDMIEFNETWSDDLLIKILEALKINNTINSLVFIGFEMNNNIALELSNLIRINKTIVSIELDISYMHYDNPTLKYLIESFKYNENIKEIRLESYNPGDLSAYFISEILKINNSIKIVDLNSTGIGDKGAFYLAESLKSNSEINYLNLEKNIIEEDGYKILAESLKINKSLTYLSLFDNLTEINDKSYKYLVDALKINNKLENFIIEEPSDKKKFYLDIFNHNKGLKYFYAYSMNPKDISYIININNNIEIVNLDEVIIDYNDANILVKALSKNKNIIFLNMRNTYFTYKGFEKMADIINICKNIKFIILPSNLEDGYYKKFCKSIQLNKTLNYIYGLEESGFLNFFNKISDNNRDLQIKKRKIIINILNKIFKNMIISFIIQFIPLFYDYYPYIIYKDEIEERYKIEFLKNNIISNLDNKGLKIKKQCIF